MVLSNWHHDWMQDGEGSTVWLFSATSGDNQNWSYDEKDGLITSLASKIPNGEKLCIDSSAGR